MAVLSIPWMVILIGIPIFIASVIVAAKGFLAPKSRRMRCRACHHEWGLLTAEHQRLAP